MKLRNDEKKKMNGKMVEGTTREFSKFKKDVVAAVLAGVFTVGGMLAALNCGADKEESPVYVASDVSTSKDAGTDVGVNKVCSSVNIERQITRKKGESFLISLNDSSAYVAEISEIDASSVSMWIYNENGTQQVFVTLKNGESRDFTINNTELNITVCSIRPVGEVKDGANSAEKTEYMATLETTKGELKVPSADAGQPDVLSDAGVDADVEGDVSVEQDAGQDTGVEQLEDVSVEEDAGVDVGVEGDAEQDAGEQDVSVEEDAGVVEELKDAGTEDTESTDAGVDVGVEQLEDASTEDTEIADAEQDVGVEQLEDAGQDAGMVCEKKTECTDTSKDYQLFNNNGVVVIETFSQQVCKITNSDCSVEIVEGPIKLTLSGSLTPDEQAIFCKQIVGDSYPGLTTKYTTNDRVSGELLQYNAAAKRNDVLYDSNNNKVEVVSVSVANGVNIVWIKYTDKSSNKTSLYQVSSSNCEPTNVGGSLYVKVYEGGNATDGVPVAVIENPTKFVNNATVTLDGKEYEVEIKTQDGQPNNLTGMTLTPKK